jgi:hypothetical protein
VVQERVDWTAITAEPRTRLDSLRRAANLRADSAAALVDTLIVSPGVVRLAVGDSLRFFDALRVEAHDRAGGLIHGVTPLFRAAPATRVRLRHGYLIALAPGSAEVSIQAARFQSGPPRADTRPLTRVPLLIETK